MAYDPDTGLILLVAPSANGPSQTWSYDPGANRWTEVANASVSPPNWYAPGLVYDSGVRKFVLFGGAGPQPFDGVYGVNETWTFDPASSIWTNVTPVVSPPRRMTQGMTYAPGIGKTVLFGGQYAMCNPSGCNTGSVAVGRNDTWTFDARTNTWTSVTALRSPPQEWGPMMAYDSVAQKVFLAMSTDGSVWLYDPVANGWQQAGYGLPAIDTALAFDSAAGAVVLSGGYQAYGGLTSETWWFNVTTATWAHASSTSAPSPREWSAMAYDAGTGVLVLFGGLNPGPYYWFGDTWLYRPMPPPAFSATANAVPLTGPAPLLVDFRADPKGGVPPYSYLWTFGDGGKAWSPFPVHAFLNAGNYTVHLTVTDAAWNTTEVDLQVTVGPPPPAGSQPPGSVAAPLIVLAPWSPWVVGGAAIVAAIVVLLLGRKRL